MKISRVVIFAAMVLTITAAVASAIGAAFTGFYPGIIVFLLLMLIPVSSNCYSKKMAGKANGSPGSYHIALTIFNLLTILVVLWMTFVILVDRVFAKIF